MGLIELSNSCKFSARGVLLHATQLTTLLMQPTVVVLVNIVLTDLLKYI